MHGIYGNEAERKNVKNSYVISKWRDAIHLPLPMDFFPNLWMWPGIFKLAMFDNDKESYQNSRIAHHVGFLMWSNSFFPQLFEIALL